MDWQLTCLFQSKSLALSIRYSSHCITPTEHVFPVHFHIHLGQIFAGLALVLMATGMEVTGNG